MRYRVCQRQVTERLRMEERDILQGDTLGRGKLCHFVEQGRFKGCHMRLLEEFVVLQPG
jgi:hypothetical protein